ncbi:mucin-17 isoform X2 [Gouania willdenowi]|uniref:mucin-17 isoform X2 n=1 Tax=Gouania willdenowi TaxID=441366 RepID=UPI001055AE07|nr:mucin-17-like isoform X2 [Gouania willdenowi]
MDEAFLESCRVNNKIYKESLDRIIDKYSKFQDLGEEFAVDLNCIHPRQLHKRLKKVENTLCDTSKILTDLEETSDSSQDNTSGSQLDATLEDGEMYESVSFSPDPADVSEMSGHQTLLSLSSLEDSQKGFPDVELQLPEEQNEELQMSLSSNGSSLMDIYPSMINRIEQAWHRQHVSLTANAVLRRYRRWRKQLNKSTLNNSSVVSSTSSTNKNPKEINNKNSRLRNPSGPVIRSAAKESLLKAVTVIPCKQSPKKQCRPITVMDFSDSDISMNETVTVSEQSPPDQNQSYIQEHDTKSSFRTKCRFPSFSSPSQKLSESGPSTSPKKQCCPITVMDFSDSDISLNETFSVSERSLPDQNQSYIQEHNTKSPFRTKWRFSSFSSPSHNLSGPSKAPEISLNETITVSEQSLPDQNQSYIQDILYTASPTHPVRSTAKASMSPMLKYKRLQPLSQTADIPTVRRSSPVRQSPLKVQLMTSHNQSPHKFNKTPVVDVMEHDNKSSFRTKCRFPSFSSPSQKLSESGPSTSPKKQCCPITVMDFSDSDISLNETFAVSERSPPDQNQSYIQEHNTKSPFRTKWRFSSFSSPSHNLSGPSKAPEISLNETITVSEQSLPDQNQSYIQDILYTASPTHPAKASMSPMLKFKRLQSLSQSARDSMCTSDIPSVRRSSPVRQSPLKVQLITSLSQSPHMLSKIPVVDVMGHDTKSPLRTKWQFSSFSCPSQKLSDPSKIPTPNSQRVFSPQRPRAHSRRHLSFDSTQPLAPLSPQQVDSEFRRVFQKFVCLNKHAPSQTHACSLCASNHSSSVLAALALSPHCSNQRKRYRGVEPGTDPQSKRLRVKRSMHSPGSKRLENENLRRCLYPARPPRGTLPCFSSDNGRSHAFTPRRFLDHLKLYKNSYG